MMDIQLALFDFEEPPVMIESEPSDSKPASRREQNPNRLSRDGFDLLDALQSPVISYPSPWASSVPRHVFNDIPLARLACLIKQEKQAALPELVAYIYPASMDFPLNREWAHIYLWVSGAYLRQYWSHAVPDLEQHLADICPESLDREEEDQLAHLSQWVYRKRRQALKIRLKQGAS